MKLTRREAMILGAGAGAVLLTGAGSAFADAAEVETLMSEFTGGATPETGRISLTAPEIAENGNTVPISVAVESPMTAGDYVADVLILADGNPRAGVATFHFTAMSGVAAASTRMRLAKTQNVIAVAKMSDGSVFMDQREVKVTIGGCGG